MAVLALPYDSQHPQKSPGAACRERRPQCPHRCFGELKEHIWGCKTSVGAGLSLLRLCSRGNPFGEQGHFWGAILVLARFFPVTLRYFGGAKAPGNQGGLWTLRCGDAGVGSGRNLKRSCSRGNSVL